jgi:hypothetical protein
LRKIGAKKSKKGPDLVCVPNLIFNNLFMQNLHSLFNSMSKRLMLLMCFTILGSISLLYGQQVFEARLSGNQEVLPAISTGQGEITATLNGTSLVVTGSFSDLSSDYNSGIGSHIHQAYAGRNGAVVVPLTPTLDADNRGGTYDAAANTFPLSQAQIDALLRREMYVNIHSVAYPGGEIRGQLLPASDDYYSANLYGSNEVPSFMSDGNGLLLMEVEGDSLKVSGTFNNLNGDFDPGIAMTGIHLHNGLAGENGGVSIFLNATVDADARGGIVMAAANAFELDAAQKAALRTRSLYVNVHSMASPSGELRGQVLNMPGLALRAHLSGANEVPAVMTGATGELALELKEDTLIVSGTFQGLESDLNVNILGGAHIHQGVAGRNGGVLFVLNSELDTSLQAGVFAADSNRFVLDSTQKAALLSRGLYVNIHTLENGGGELRGQILPQGAYFFNAALSGTNEVPPVLSTGYGQLNAEIKGDQLVVSGSFNETSGDYAASHLHLGFAGSNGGVAFALNPMVDADNRGGLFHPDSNTFTLSPGLIDTFRARMFYANLHTSASPSGELRGQLLHEATNYFVAPLSGTSSVPPVKANGSGALNLEWTGGKVLASGSFNGLESDFTIGAHIHLGMAGNTGGVLFPLTPVVDGSNRNGTFAVSDNMFDITAGQIDTLRQRMMYVNVHSTDNPGGELRGNLLPQATAYFTTTAQGKNEVPRNESTGMGALKLELSGDNLAISGAFSGLLSKYNENIGSHLHLAAPGANGGVQVVLMPTLSADSLSGRFEASNNTFTLDSAQKVALYNGEMYLNIHTDSIASGELRGQILPESNFFPNDDATIVSPPDGSILVVKGAVDSVLMPTWTQASDPNDNYLVYTWQLALDTAFTQVLVNQEVGTDLNAALTFGAIDTLLANSGLNVGDTVTLYHRAEASDGSVCSGGMGAMVTLVRDTVGTTNIEDYIYDNFSLNIYPSPTTGQSWVNIDSDIRAEGGIRVMDMLGRTIINQNIMINPGENEFMVNVASFDSGIYFVRMEVKGQLIDTIKLIKQ